MVTMQDALNSFVLDSGDPKILTVIQQGISGSSTKENTFAS
jgi:hypothetical protein